MKTKCLIVILGLATVACAQSPQSKGQDELQTRIQAITTAFVAGDIAYLEILQIPSRIETRSRITPEMIERSFDYKLTIRYPASSVHKGTLLKALHSVSARPSGEMKDIRWGVIFYGEDGARVGAFYFDKSGTYGAVDGIPASFKGDLFEWLERGFSGCFL